MRRSINNALSSQVIFASFLLVLISVTIISLSFFVYYINYYRAQYSNDALRAKALFESLSYLETQRSISLEEYVRNRDMNIAFTSADGRIIASGNDLQKNYDAKEYNLALKNCWNQNNYLITNLFNTFFNRRLVFVDVFSGHAYDGTKKTLTMIIVYDIAEHLTTLWHSGLYMLLTLVLFLVVFFLNNKISSFRIEKAFNALVFDLNQITKRDFTKEISKVIFTDFDSIINSINQLTKTINNQLNLLQEYAERQKSFTANAAHELRTPITGIKALAETASSMTNDDFQRNNFNIIAEKSETLGNIINDMMLLANMDSACSTAIELLPVNLSAVITETINIHLQKWQNKQHFLKHNIEKNIIVYTSKTLAKILVGNLIDNAMKYSPEHSNIIIKLRSDRETGSCIFSVANSNASIPVEELPFVFDRFYRCSKHSGDIGSGIGLAIVKQIATRLSIKLKVDSLDGNTEFYACFPVNPELH